MGLNSAFATGVAGLDSYSSALSVVSDNVANANTTAFKSNSVTFGDLVAGYYATLSQETSREGTGSAILSISPKFSQGSMIATGNWSDLSINGNGFFSVIDSSGQTLYTRDGSFHVDKDGYLVNSQGHQVVDQNTGAAIQIEADPAVPVYANYTIDSTGGIYGTPVAGGAPVLIGTIRVSTFPNPAGLIRQGGNEYIPGPESGTAVDGVPGSGPRGSLIASALEGSNVDLATEMVNMVIYQANYSANSKSIRTADNMLQTVTNLVP